MAAVQAGDPATLDGVLTRQRAHLLRELHSLTQARKEQSSTVVELLITAAELHIRADLGVIDAAEKTLPAEPTAAASSQAAHPAPDGAVYLLLVALPPARASVSVNSGVPEQPGPPYRVKVTVPPGLDPPVTAAVSATLVPVTAVAGCWVVVMAGVAFAAAAPVRVTVAVAAGLSVVAVRVTKAPTMAAPAPMSAAAKPLRSPEELEVEWAVRLGLAALARWLATADGLGCAARCRSRLLITRPAHCGAGQLTAIGASSQQVPSQSNRREES
jgi:hypothetical protein